MNKDKAYIVNNAKLLANPEEPVMEEHKLQREFIDVLKSKGELDKFEAYLKTEFPTTMSVLEYCNLFAPSHWWITSENSWNAYIVQYHPEAIKPEVNIFAENSIWPALSTHIDSVAAPNISESTTITFKGGGSIARADCEFVDFKGVYRIDEPSEENPVINNRMKHTFFPRQAGKTQLFVLSDPDRAKRSWLMQAEMKKKGRPEDAPNPYKDEFLAAYKKAESIKRKVMVKPYKDEFLTGFTEEGRRRDFKAFLIRNNALSLFEQNMLNCPHDGCEAEPSVDEAWRELFMHHDLDWVSSAFCWDKTGDSDFWSALDDEWAMIEPEKSPMDTFREYLESQEVLDKFGRIMLLSFIQDSNIDFPIEEDAWSNLKIHAPVCWVKCAFEWEKSGDARFWEHIHARWVVICRANKWE